MARHTFGSDNHAPAHPEVLAALARVNEGHSFPYGADGATAAAVDVVRAHLGESAEVAFVFNGTGANLVGLGLALRPWQHVVCATTAHIAVDECGGPERLLGTKLVELATPDGKLTPDLVRSSVSGVGDEHRTQPGAVSITQSSELGTVYSLDEVAALAELAHEQGLLLHVDGARLANAACSLGMELRELTTDAGVDVVSFGATKNGALGAEAVVLLRADLGDGVQFMRKQSMQLASKMRFVAAQFEALLDGERWRDAAGHANAMARRLADAVRGVPGVRITQEVQANAVFAVLSPGVAARLQERWRFYVWDESTGEVRWMCAWDTTPEDVDAFAADVEQVAEGS